MGPTVGGHRGNTEVICNLKSGEPAERDDQFHNVAVFFVKENTCGGSDARAGLRTYS